jgi:alkylation response protein AidB-like acyl-CoA dehydrogenase
MNLDFGEKERELRREIRGFLHKELPEHWLGIFYEGNLADSLRVTEEMGRKGWLTRHWPTEYGGVAASLWEQVVVQEELWSHHEPRGGQYMGVNWIGSSIMGFGTKKQKEEFLPAIARGQVQWAQLFSEPDAGSDLASLRTSARLDGDLFIVNGEKVWTSYANYAKFGFLLARTEPGTSGREGLSVFLIDMDSEGIEVREIPSMLGWHRLHSVSFRSVRVPKERLLGQVNHGWNVAMTALSTERTGNARYARTTRILRFVERCEGAQEPAIQCEISGLLSFGRMAELMNYRVVALREKNKPVAWEGSAARLYSVLYEMAAASLIERVLGPLSIVGGEDVYAPFGGEIEAFVVRDAPMSGVGSGTYEVQVAIVAERGLGLPRSR